MTEDESVKGGGTNFTAPFYDIEKAFQDMKTQRVNPSAFVKAMITDLNDINEGTDEEVHAELVEMGIDIVEAEMRFFSTLKECSKNRAERMISKIPRNCFCCDFFWWGRLADGLHVGCCFTAEFLGNPDFPFIKEMPCFSVSPQMAALYDGDLAEKLKVHSMEGLREVCAYLEAYYTPQKRGKDEP